MKFEVYKDAGNEYRWRLVAANGKTVADSGEGYQRRAAAVRAVVKLQAQVAAAEIVDAVVTAAPR